MSLIDIKTSEREVHPFVTQRIIIKFLARECLKPSEIWRRLRGQFQNDCLKKSQVYEWHKQCGTRCKAVENELYPSASANQFDRTNIDAVLTINIWVFKVICSSAFITNIVSLTLSFLLCYGIRQNVHIGVWDVVSLLEVCIFCTTTLNLIHQS